jgi:hypothetical protein
MYNYKVEMQTVISLIFENIYDGLILTNEAKLKIQFTNSVVLSPNLSKNETILRILLVGF